MSKLLPRLCSPVSAPPYSPHGLELQGAESLQSPTLTGPPARRSSYRLTCEYHYIRVVQLVQLFSSRVGRIFLDCTGHSLVLVLSLFSSYNVIKITVFVYNSGRRIKLVDFSISFSWMSVTCWIP